MRIELMLVLGLVCAGTGSDRAASAPIHDAASAGDLGKVRALLAQGASVDARNKEERTPLHVAAEGGHARVVDA